MSEWRGYFYIENLGLNNGQRSTLVQALQAWGMRNADPNPCNRNHWIIRGDNNACVFEGHFEANNMTTLWLRTKLAEIFSVPVNNITATTTTTEYGPLITCKYSNVDRLRVGIFAGLAATYLESQAAARHYLADFAAVWHP